MMKPQVYGCNVDDNGVSVFHLSAVLAFDSKEDRDAAIKIITEAFHKIKTRAGEF